MAVLTVPGKDKILGVTIVGEHGGDLLTEFVLAMKHGLGLNKILGTVIHGFILLPIVRVSAVLHSALNSIAALSCSASWLRQRNFF